MVRATGPCSFGIFMRIPIGSLLVALCLPLALPGPAAAGPPAAQSPPAQSPPAEGGPATVQELLLADGSRLYGSVVAEAAGELTFRTHAGATVVVKRDQVVSMRTVKGHISAGEFQPADPNTTRLFFGPTGRAPARGQAYLGVYSIVLPFVQVGVTDRFSVGAGTPLVFGFDESDRPFWVTPKFQVFNSPSTQISTGVLHLLDLGGDHHAGIAYVVGTRGGPAQSVTAGVGLAYERGPGRSGVVMVGGERRVRRNLKLLTENYAWDGGGIVSGGVRFLGEKLSADVGLGIPVGLNDGFLAFPVVNFVYVF